MQKKPLVVAATGLVGALTSGLVVTLMAWPVDAAERQVLVKRAEDSGVVVG